MRVINPRPYFRFLIAALFAAAVAHAQDRNRKATGKIYVADAEGDARINTGAEIIDMSKKSVFPAEGTVIETKPNSNASVVLSNGTGIYFDVSTRVEIRKFDQEGFRPNRSDIEDEPSISRTRLYIDYGVIGVSTSKLASGSTMEFDTSLASAWIRGRQAVIMSGDSITVISMLEGDATVQAGPLDRLHEVKSRQQIIITPGKPGKANIVVIQDIPEGSVAEAWIWLDERVITADAARKLVYFEVQVRKGSDGVISLFDGSLPTAPAMEIVPVPVVPADPPTQPTVSDANLSSR